jgi:c-di-GMP-binding flagellar brake protein YcgR
MARDRREGSKRVRTKLQARVGYGKVAVRRILIKDISESGAAVRCETGELPSFCNLDLEFSLPGDPENIHATAELVWRDDSGRAGLRFLDMASSARKRLARWLREQLQEKTSRAAALAARAGR